MDQQMVVEPYNAYILPSPKKEHTIDTHNMDKSACKKPDKKKKECVRLVGFHLGKILGDAN